MRSRDDRPTRGDPAALVAPLLFVLATACGDQPRYLVVEVSASAGGPEVHQLRVAVTLGDRDDSFLTPEEPSEAALALPADLSLELPEDATGDLAISIEGLDAGQETVASGRAEAPLAAAPDAVAITLVACQDRVAGPETVGGTWGSFAPDHKFANQVVFDADALVAGLELYAKGQEGTTGSQAIRAVLYRADPESGEPGALVDSGEEITIAGGAAAGWTALPFAAPVAIEAGTYWIGVHAGGPDFLTLDALDEEAEAMRMAIEDYADGPADPYGEATTADARMSLHALYDGCQ